jgi:transketolase
LEHKTDVYKKRFDSFGWNSIVIDGHNLDAIIKSFEKSRSQKDVPTMIIAKTYKGKYIPEIED